MGEKRLLSQKELKEYIGIGFNSARQFGKRIGAEVQIGGRKMYDKEVIDRYIEEHAGKGEQDGKNQEQK